MMDKITFEFYGVTAEISLPSRLKEDIRKDFSYFERDSITGAPSVTLTVYEEKPPFEKIPAVRSSLYQPDSISYDHGGKRYVDYFGRALSIYDFAGENGELFSEDRELIHELSYLLILSRVGEMLDKKGIHRVHAFAVSFKGKGILCLLPQGGGKTTLYLELAKNKDVELISDDIPLITKDLKILPFPLRIGVAEGAKLDIPREYLGSIERRKYGKKILIDARYFSGRISSPVGIDIILKGEREYSDNPRIVKAGKAAVFIALLRDCVIGLGLPQMVEYFLRYGFGEIAAKLGIVLSRKITCLKAVFKARTYVFVIGIDVRKNADTLIEFLSKI